MNAGLDKFMMRLRMESKTKENQNKPQITSSDIVQTADFVFSQGLHHDGDSGKLLLAKRKTDRKEQYLVKHEYTDCACNEFVYTKLVQAMGYSMPDAILFQLSPGEKRSCFKTEYIIGERYLTVVDPSPTYETVREKAKNWEHYFAFLGLYGLTDENDGIELLLANDERIYRVDTTDAFPISNYQLDVAGINKEINGYNKEISGYNPYIETRKMLLSQDFSGILNLSSCNWCLKRCLKTDAGSLPYFLEPFARIRDIPSDYIDGFLNTLCYFYPDFIGDYFKLYLSALQEQCWAYYKEKR